MKKLNITMMVIFTVLFFCVFLMGCDNNPDTGETVNVQGKVIILQAYGSSSSAAGASHSFVELYNISDEDINLDGISLYYANGTSVAQAEVPNTATEDGQWKRISLDGRSIPAKGSFLILGPKESATARYQIPDNSGDINDENFTLSNRAFKVALLQSTAELTVQNPFNPDDSGKPVSGYIDMVGAANEYQGRDLIFGFETAPARCSASEAVRRLDLVDTDDNRGVSTTFPDAGGDFTSIRYSLPSDNGISDEELEVYKPRNLIAGKWDPFAAPEPPPPPENPTAAGNPSPLAGKLLILQAYGTGTATDGAVSHSFIELYNNTESPVDLNAYSLQYANTTGTDWAVINLTGTIPAKGSYLVRGNNNNTSGRLQLDIADQDVEFYLNNNGFKVALMANQKMLTVANPFAMTGGKAEDYVDLIGATNGSDPDAFEGTLLSGVISKQAAARRGSLTDTDDNSADFVRIDYRTSGTTDEQVDQYKPRTSGDSAWDPFAEPEPPIVTEGSPILMILQIGASADDSNNVSHTFVELYNNTSQAITLNGAYSLQYAEGTKVASGATEDLEWVKIDLTGTIEPYHSFLILGAKRSTNNTPGLKIDDNSGDMNEAEFKLSNRAGKVVLMKNQTLLNVQNPFAGNGGQPITDYVDMIGYFNDATDQIFGFETQPIGDITKQAGARRTTLTDNNNNLTDFEKVAYNNVSTDVALKRPKNLAHGAWNPITGE